MVDNEIYDENSLTLATDTNIEYLYDYSCASSALDEEYYCMTVTINILNTDFDYTVHYRAIARDSVGSDDIMSNVFKYHCFAIKPRYESDSGLE